MVKIKRALISVYDKTNLAEFVKGLKELGIEIISTGGTAEFIKSQGIEVKNISDMTQEYTTKLSLVIKLQSPNPFFISCFYLCEVISSCDCFVV